MDFNLVLEKMNEFQKLKKNQVNLTADERKIVADKEAEWSDKRSAVWKSIDPKTGKATFVTNTHRAWNKAPSIEGACGKFHKFIKGTA